MIQTPEDHFQRDGVEGQQQFFGHGVAQVDQHGEEEAGIQTWSSTPLGKPVHKSARLRAGV